MDKQTTKWQTAFFILGIATLLVAIWAGYYTYKSYELSKENQELKEQINVISYGQQGGITAGNINIGQIQRHLTEDDAKELELMLKNINAKGVIIRSVGDQGEPYNYAYEIKVYLEKRGWQVEGVIPSVYNSAYKGPMNGVSINIILDEREFAEITVGNALQN